MSLLVVLPQTIILIHLIFAEKCAGEALGPRCDIVLQKWPWRCILRKQNLSAEAHGFHRSTEFDATFLGSEGKMHGETTSAGCHWMKKPMATHRNSFLTIVFGCIFVHTLCFFNCAVQVTSTWMSQTNFWKKSFMTQTTKINIYGSKSTCNWKSMIHRELTFGCACGSRWKISTKSATGINHSKGLMLPVLRSWWWIINLDIKI